MVPSAHGMKDVVAREREAVAAHRSSLRGAAMPPPSAAPRGTFAHGFLLPFSLIAATFRDPTLRGPFVRTTAVRLLVIALLTGIGLASGSSPHDKEGRTGPVVVVHHDIGTTPPSPSAGVHVHVPGVQVDLNEAPGAKSEVKVLGQSVPVVDIDEHAQEAKKKGPIGPWKWLLAVIAMISGSTAFVIALSRRYDDWLGFGISALASIQPEDAERKTPKIGVDWKWLWKKLKERIRESVAFAAGMPLIALLQLVPTAGDVLFKIASVAWGWYWLGVFTAAKSDHALVDAPVAPPPRLLRGVLSVSSAHWLFTPFRLYARLWARLGRSFDAPAAVFERTPAPFLGLGLARAILSLPGLYVMSKSIIPVAAGRLIAESDPHGRFAAERATGEGTASVAPPALDQRSAA
jgi:hypothetical protein